MLEMKASIHLFFFCIEIHVLCYKLTQWIGNVIEIRLITPQYAIFGFAEIKANRQIIKYFLIIS